MHGASVRDSAQHHVSERPGAGCLERAGARHHLRHSAKCELAGETLRLFGTLRLRVNGLSMLPSIWPGDLLLIQRQQMTQVSEGDVVLFARRGRLFAHRVVHIHGERQPAFLITRGDALPGPDAPVTLDEFLGKVCFVLRGGAWVEVPTRRGWDARLIGVLASWSGRAAAALARVHALGQNRAERKVLCQG